MLLLARWKAMNMREEIVAKVQNLPESVLPEIYEFIEQVEEKDEKPSLMERLRKIKIQGPPDFAENFDLYMSGEKSLDDYIEKDNKL